MSSDLSRVLDSFAAIQGELRKLMPAAGASDVDAVTAPAFDNQATDFVIGVGLALTRNLFGCRLLHWNPDLANFRSEIVLRGRPGSFIVYRPLDVRIGGRTHVYFAKVYKTKYLKPGQPRSAPGVVERQFGITYSGFRSKRELTPVLDAFKRCAAEAGQLVAFVNERLGDVLPTETLAAKDSFHRWIFTVYDVAWKAPPGSPQAATKYIPMKGFDEFMRTDESVLYDLDHLRSTPWSEVERRLDKHGWRTVAPFEGPYASWSKELPEYYASRIDDIVQASYWTIGWLVKELQGGT